MCRKLKTTGANERFLSSNDLIPHPIHVRMHKYEENILKWEAVIAQLALTENILRKIYIMVYLKTEWLIISYKL